MVESLRSVLPELQMAADTTVGALKDSGRILTCGNGGSALEAQHLSAELVGHFQRHSRRSLPAYSLCADSGVITATANDFGYEHVFSRALEGFGTERDVLVAFSTSGQSPNIVSALQVAHRTGIKSILFGGARGGQAAALADVAVLVPASSTTQIQEGHLILVHLLCDLIDEEFDE